MSINMDLPQTTDAARTLRADLVERAAQLQPGSTSSSSTPSTARSTPARRRQ